MAGASLLTLLDDIATVLDDVALMTKVAAQKTAGVLGDDLALNAEQVAGVRAERELPVVWAVAKGSLKNKAILVPAALAISSFIPWAVTPLLMVGGAYLCYEGVEKIVDKFFHRAEGEVERKALEEALTHPAVDLVAYEKEKIQGAIRTDFILSAEIVTIALGTVADASFMTQVIVLIGVALLMTVGVYGVVGIIVKLDDAGLYLTKKEGTHPWQRLVRGFGGVLLNAAPYLMKSLTWIGTLAMFTVGGSILMHGIPAMHAPVEALTESAGEWAFAGPVWKAVTPLLVSIITGIIAGVVVLAGTGIFQRLFRSGRKTS
jgi:predicted DNA repair protein MutK